MLKFHQNLKFFFNILQSSQRMNVAWNSESNN